MRRVIGIALGLSVVIGVLVTAFVWPSSEIAPRDVLIAVAGPPEAAAAVSDQLEQAVPDGFSVDAVASEQEARDAIADRDVYGAVVLSPSGPPTVLTASSASPVVAQLLQGVATSMAASSGEEAAGPVVEDVAPPPSDDPRGTGFSSGALPLVIGGIAIGAAMSFVVSGVGRRLVGASVAALGGGAVAVAVMQSWLGVLDGNWWANAGAYALTLAAASVTLIGLHALLGHVGAALGAATFLLLGNPLSGITSAPELLPSGWGAFGQLLPPGAGGSLLRSTAFFDGAAAGQPVLVLSGWIVLGLVLAAVGARRAPVAPAEPTSGDVEQVSFGRA
ncbi:ABC transporter permease [Jiangella rhizosphaerae]|uniref:ABC transporter permease n=1 Tax=Jiangella rhizosphaerae TaxID=2293569 RepID=A0A418KRZ9_9ACTN|nr:ABC transporter permease [Jiangella rhizosphaerae]RIQ24954.1 ABC transporter permease [Jiangella rhizosphaerae]